jgi:serine/threonine protein phosphatase 1
MSAEESGNRGRLLAVGDIHGCRASLEGLLEKVALSEADRLIFLGDYIDRGPDSKGVIDFLLALARHFPRTVFLRGNHEAMFLDFLAGRNRDLYLANGGISTLESYREEEGIVVPGPHLDFLHSLPLYYATDRFIFVHAGLRPGIPLEEQREEDLLWIRDEFLESDYDWGRTVVFGHTPLPQPFFSAARIGLDTGAVYGRSLVCCDVERLRLWSSP